MLVEAVAFIGIAIIVLAAAVWFGKRIIAPPIQRAIDRADEDEDPGD